MYTYHILKDGQHTHFVIGERLEPMEGGETAVITDSKGIVAMIRLGNGVSIVRAE